MRERVTLGIHVGNPDALSRSDDATVLTLHFAENLEFDGYQRFPAKGIIRRHPIRCAWTESREFFFSFFLHSTSTIDQHVEGSSSYNFLSEREDAKTQRAHRDEERERDRSFDVSPRIDESNYASSRINALLFRRDSPRAD